MATLWLFNPENDGALAAPGRHYTPPAAAVTLHNDGELLPRWLAAPDDAILVGSLSGAPSLVAADGSRPQPVDSYTDFCPWGWSYHARSQFIAAGVDPARLPTDDCLDALRSLSHRRTTIGINRRLADAFPDAVFPPAPIEITDTAALPAPPFCVKLPWSSSGRGVAMVETVNAECLSAINGMIRRQGSVTVETRLDKVLDFAALFHSDGHAVSYRGLSLFEADANGVWQANLVAPEDSLRSRLAQLLPLDFFDAVCATLATELTALIAPLYRGWLGVDMMIFRDSSPALRLAPCVEINLRMTMGIVAHLLRERPELAPAIPGRFLILPKNCSQAADGDIDLLGDHARRFRFVLRPETAEHSV